MRLPALVLACLTTMLSLPLRWLRTRRAAVPGHGTATDAKLQERHRRRVHPGQGLRHRQDRSAASLNISFYGVFRYMNQMPGEQTFTDHLGRERTVKARNDLNWHRTFVWLTGFFWDPKFRYNISLWSLPTTQQTLLFGNLAVPVQPGHQHRRRASRPTSPRAPCRAPGRSGARSDRQMAEEFFRGGFSSGVLRHRASRSSGSTTPPRSTRNISQLGITAANDTRDYGVQRERRRGCRPPASSGRAAGFGDLEYHQKLATRFGLSAGTQPRRPLRHRTTAPPNATPDQALRRGQSVRCRRARRRRHGREARLRRDRASMPGFKYRGFSFQGEYYVRRLSDFHGHGPVAAGRRSWTTASRSQAMHMVVPQAGRASTRTYGKVFDDFKRHPWEVSGGVSFYPSGTPQPGA